MKTYKQIDFWGSVVLIIGFTVAGIIRLDYTFIIGYFVVGAWQLISIAIHRLNHWFTNKGSDRKCYQSVVLVMLCALLLCGLIMLIGEIGWIFLMVYLFVMLFAAPILAIIYTFICCNELFVAIPKRELAHLK